MTLQRSPSPVCRAPSASCSARGARPVGAREIGMSGAGAARSLPALHQDSHRPPRRSRQDGEFLTGAADGRDPRQPRPEAHLGFERLGIDAETELVEQIGLADPDLVPGALPCRQANDKAAG